MKRCRAVKAVLAAWVTFACVLGATEARAQSRQPVYAIVVGHNAPPPNSDPDGASSGLQTLRYADDDAVRFYGLLSTASDHAVLLADMDADTRRRHSSLAARAEPPTPSAFSRAVRDIQRRVKDDLTAGRRPVVFLTYSGHGSDDERGAFLTLSGGTLTRATLLEDTLAGFAGAEVHLFIDACNAGAMVASRGAFDKEVDVATVKITPSAADAILRDDGARVGALPQVGAFLAAAPSTEAHEWTRVESGVFTHEILSGLYGAADVNGDLRIEYGELHAFITAANSGVSDPRARPQMMVRPPDGNANAVLLDLSTLRDVRWLVGDAAGLGHFHVELSNGQRLFDAHLAQGARHALALPRSSDAFVVSSLGEALVESDGPLHVPFATLGHSAPQRVARGSIDRALRTQWFQTEYSRVYYSGFMDSRGLPPTQFDAQRDVPGGGPGVAPLAPAESLPLLTSPTLQSPRGLPEIDGDDSGLRAGLWITTGVAAAVGLTGAIIAIDANAQFDGDTTQRRADELDTLYRTGTILGIAGGATALGAVATALWLQPSPDQNFDVALGPITRARLRW